MPQPVRSRHRLRPLRAAAVALALVVLVGAATAGSAEPGRWGDGGAVSAWAGRTAQPLATTSPADPLDDVAPLRPSIGDATIVGLGESVHGIAEEITLKHRFARLLVEGMGFRSIAWEEDWTTGLEIDDYIRGGPGDPAELVTRMSPQYQSGQVAEVLRWLRAFNAGRREQVRFVGVEHYFTRARAYDEVEGYVAETAPGRLDQLRPHLQPLRPTSADPFEHIGWYTGQADKQPYVDHARAVRDLVDLIPHRPGDRAHALAMHNADQIVSFYEYHRLPPDQGAVYREVQAAGSLRWWQELTGDRVVYWAASPHTANAPDLRIVQPPAADTADMRFPSAGSYLRQWYGDRYLSVGFTVDHGIVRLGPSETAVLAAPAADWFEHPLGRVDHDQFVVDLRQPAPPPVRRWLHQPTSTRGLPDAGPGSSIDGGSVAQWFDLIVHLQRFEVGPAV